MTYETKIVVEIAGIRRSLPLEFDYRVAMINGRRQPVRDAVSVLWGARRFSGEWIYEAIGDRQLEALNREMLVHWDSQNSAARPVRRFA